MGGTRGGTGGPDPSFLENPKLFYVTLEMLVRTSIKKPLDLIVSRWRSVRPLPHALGV